MTGSLPGEAITFGVDDLFYAPSLSVVRAAETGRSGSSELGAEVQQQLSYRFTFSVQGWCFHPNTTTQSHAWERRVLGESPTLS